MGAFHDASSDADPHEPATLQRDVGVDPYTATQLPVRVDPYANRSYDPNAAQPITGTAPLGMMAPGVLARDLYGVSQRVNEARQQAHDAHHRLPPNTPAIPPPPPLNEENSLQSHPALAAPPMVAALAALRPPSDPGVNIEREPEAMLDATGPNHTALIPVVQGPPPKGYAPSYGATPNPSNARRGLVAVGIGASLGLVVVVGISLIVLLVRGPKTPVSSTTVTATTETATVTPTTTASVAPEISSSVIAEVQPSVSTPPPAPDTSDAAAIAALEKLRDSIELCVRDKIHTLPGTSRAIPDSLNHLKNGPYRPLSRDWVAPFFSCTGFRLETPMPFMIQWQFQRPDTMGTGVAWIDDDKDGKADRAYAFTGKLAGKGAVEFSAIEPTDATRRPQKPR